MLLKGNSLCLESSDEAVSHVGLGQLPTTRREEIVEMEYPTTSNSSSVCTAQCCVDVSNVFHSNDNLTIKSATSERTFSAVKHIYTYVRLTMTEKRLNNCLLLHVHKDLTDSLDLPSIAREFVFKYDERKKYFGNFFGLIKIYTVYPFNCVSTFKVIIFKSIVQNKILFTGPPTF